MTPTAAFPGTKRHQALLEQIVAYYREDPRIRAVIVFGSLGRGSWDDYSDLDLDLIIADEARIDVAAELLRLCASFTGLNERAVLIIPDEDEGDIVLESLVQLSIRYHPLAQTSPNIVDSMLVLGGSLEAADIAAAGKANDWEDTEPLRRLLDRCLRYAVVANVEFQRRHFWAANEVLHRMRALLMDLYARTHGGFRGYQFFDIHAEKRIQQLMGAALPVFEQASLRESFQRTLDILESNLSDLSGGQLDLIPAQKIILARVRRQISSNADGVR